MYLIGHLYFSLENECHFFLEVLPHNQLLTRLNLQCNLNRPDKKRATLMTRNSSFKLNITNQLVVYYTLVIFLWCQVKSSLVCANIWFYMQGGKKKKKKTLYSAKAVPQKPFTLACDYNPATAKKKKSFWKTTLNLMGFEINNQTWNTVMLSAHQFQLTQAATYKISSMLFLSSLQCYVTSQLGASTCHCKHEPPQEFLWAFTLQFKS